MQVKQQNVKYSSSEIIWYFNKNWHRDGDLPAEYDFTGGKLTAVYYNQHRKLHRTTGPALINYKYKTKRYYYQGKEYASLDEMQMIEACR